MQIMNFCVILRENSFSMTEIRGSKLSYDIEKPAASGRYLKLLAFQNSQFLLRKYSYSFSKNGLTEKNVVIAFYTTFPHCEDAI